MWGGCAWRRRPHGQGCREGRGTNQGKLGPAEERVGTGGAGRPGPGLQALERIWGLL